MRKLQGTVLVVAVFAIVATACSSGGSSPSSTSNGGSTSSSITAENFAFSPSSVNVNAGKVTVTVTNKDSVEHTFTLDDGSSSTNLQPGKTETITLNLTKTVGWHCMIHPTMTGTLNVK